MCAAGSGCGTAVRSQLARRGPASGARLRRPSRWLARARNACGVRLEDRGFDERQGWGRHGRCDGGARGETLATAIIDDGAMTEFPFPSVSKAPRRVCLDVGFAGLMVIDVQNGFINTSSALVVPTIVDLVERWTANDRPVLMSRYRNYSGSPYERLLGWRELHRAPDIDVIDELVGFLDHPMTTVIDKTGYTALTVEAVEHWHGAGVTDLLLCGIATDGCVFKTALDVFEAGFTPWVVVRCCRVQHHAPSRARDPRICAAVARPPDRRRPVDPGRRHHFRADSVDRRESHHDMHLRAATARDRR